MKLTNTIRDAIIRAIVQDIPKPDKKGIHAKVQADVLKHMSPECRKVYNRTPKALATENTSNVTYDQESWDTRIIVLGDCPKDTLEALLKPYRDDETARAKAHSNIHAAVYACTTLKQLKTQLPEFEKYFPKEDGTPNKFPVAINNLVADLTKLGWPKQETK